MARSISWTCPATAMPRGRAPRARHGAAGCRATCARAGNSWGSCSSSTAATRRPGRTAKWCSGSATSRCHSSWWRTSWTSSVRASATPRCAGWPPSWSCPRPRPCSGFRTRRETAAARCSSGWRSCSKRRRRAEAEPGRGSRPRQTRFPTVRGNHLAPPPGSPGLPHVRHCRPRADSGILRRNLLCPSPRSRGRGSRTAAHCPSRGPARNPPHVRRPPAHACRRRLPAFRRPHERVACRRGVAPHRGGRAARAPAPVDAGTDHRADVRGAPLRRRARSAPGVCRAVPLPARRLARAAVLRGRRRRPGEGPRPLGRLSHRVPDRRRRHRGARRARLGPQAPDHVPRHARGQHRDLRARSGPALPIRTCRGAPRLGAPAVHPGRRRQVAARRGRLPARVEVRLAVRGNGVSIQTIAVVGGGIMGRGIAYVAAVGGYQTLLHDANREQLEHGINEVSAILEKGIAVGRMTDGEALEARKRLRAGISLEEGARGADLVIEAVPERIELKVELFAQLDRVAPPHAILATNTSSLSVTQMAAATRRAPQVVGLHFFNPVHRMKLLEIVRALETSAMTLQICEEVGRRMGKECVTVRESPGFVTSRINAMIGNEAFYMLQEGVASAADIDKALKLGLNHPMGPFELVDLVGLDTRLSILRFLHRTLGEKFRPCPLMEQYVSAGRLGRKSGRGVYEYAAAESTVAT